MGDTTVMLVAVLVPCLITTLAVATILYHGFYRDWMDRCLYSGPRTGDTPSEPQRQQHEADDNISNGNKNDDVEALRAQGHPSLEFTPVRSVSRCALR